jgi:hypothetical protein
MILSPLVSHEAEITGVCHHTWLINEMVFNFLLELTLYCDSLIGAF